MESHLNNDPELRIYIVLDNLVYIAGEIVTGTIYLRAKCHKAYESLHLSFSSKESIYIAKSGQKAIDIYRD